MPKRLASSQGTGSVSYTHLDVYKRQVQDGEEITFSANYACTHCGISIEEITPRMFSFNSPFGACPTCSGLGILMKMDPELMVDDWNKSLGGGALSVMGSSGEDASMTCLLYTSRCV